MGAASVAPFPMEYSHGNWNVACQRCGFKYKSDQIAREWTGLRVCRGGGTNDCWEERHPQEFKRGKVDKQAPAWTAPEQTDVFLEPGDVTPDDL